MKAKKQIAVLFSALVALSGLAATAAAKVNAKDLAAISVPDELQTTIGTLQFEAGAPTPETAQTVYDYLDQMRGVQLFG